MNKKILTLGAFALATIVGFSAFSDTQTDEQKIASGVETAIAALKDAKKQECEAKIAEAATQKADALIAAMPAAKPAIAATKPAVKAPVKTAPKKTTKGTTTGTKGGTTTPTPAPVQPAPPSSPTQTKIDEIRSQSGSNATKPDVKTTEKTQSKMDKIRNGGGNNQ